MIPGMPVAAPYRHRGYVINRVQSNRGRMSIRDVQDRVNAILEASAGDTDPEGFHVDRDNLTLDILHEIALGAEHPKLHRKVE